jgi:hypothetical protein
MVSVAMQAQKNLIYLYCVTKTKPSQSDFEDVGVKIYPIYFQGTYAVITKVSPDEFSEDNLKKNLANIEWVEKRIRQHERIIEEIMKDATVLPFKFGTVFQSEENVEKLLKEHHTDFKQIIENLDGKEEWGLKIYCNLDKFKESLTKTDERIQELDKQIASTSEGKAYLLKKKKEGLIKEVINEKISEYTQDSFTRLKRACLEAKINKILPKEVTEREDEMVFNAAFLINKNRIKDLENVLSYLKTKYSDKGLIFDCTGPWPAYNFCTLPEEKTRE